MRTIWALGFGLWTLGLSTPSTSLGKIPDTSHSAVVAVGVDQPNRGAATGTLVGPRLVLTAGHVSPIPADGLPAWAVSFGPDATVPTVRIRVDPATASHPHPAFVAFVNEFGRNPGERPDFFDVGALGLPEAATGVRPVTLPQAGMLDHLVAGDRFVGVGYGYSEVIRESNAGVSTPFDGKRRQWRSGVKVLNAAWMRLEDEPSKGFGQICRGDSGAPIFLVRGGREILVGVVSHSDGQGCGPGIPTYAARVDNPQVLSWLAALNKTTN